MSSDYLGDIKYFYFSFTALYLVTSAFIALEFISLVEII
jgi:hypothetical protein